MPISQNTINTVDRPFEIEPNTDGNIQLQHDGLGPNITEAQFNLRIREAEQNALSYWSKLDLQQRQEKNYKYWVGDQINTAVIRDDLEKSADNIIFRNIETYIPIATARTPEFTCTPVYKNEETRQFAKNAKLMVRAEWEIENKMQMQVGRGIRNHQLNFAALFGLGYDEETGECWTEELSMTDVVVDKKGDVVIRHIKDKKLGFLLDSFPDKAKDILKMVGHSASITVTDEIRNSPVEYIEAWTDEMVGWKLATLTLGVERNPHFDYEGEEFQVSPDQPMINPITGFPEIDPATGKIGIIPGERKKVFFNHFKKPRKPFLFLTYWNRGIHLYDDTTLIEQAIGLQDWVNKRKRQIGANADSTNGHWVSSGEYISQGEFEKLEGGIDEKIWLESGKPADGFIKLTGQPLPDYVYTDLQDSRAAADSLMGIEAITRGAETNNKTLGQDMIQQNQNQGRIDGYIRDGVEMLAQDWAEYTYHLKLVYSRKPQALALPEDTDVETDTLFFSRDDVPLVETAEGELIPVPMVFQVKPGSTLPDDEQATYHKATQMKDILRPRDYYKMIGMPNPRELEKNYLMYTMDPLADYMDDPDIMAMVQRQQQAAMAQEQAAQEQAAQEGEQQSQQKQMELEARAQQQQMQGQQQQQLEQTKQNGAIEQALVQSLLQPQAQPGS